MKEVDERRLHPRRARAAAEAARDGIQAACAVETPAAATAQYGARGQRGGEERIEEGGRGRRRRTASITKSSVHVLSFVEVFQEP
jgi:hypothetical protein